MATILPFVIPPRSATAAARKSEGSAEIVIFPGVRYEAARDDSLDGRRKSGGTVRKRKSGKSQ